MSLKQDLLDGLITKDEYQRQREDFTSIRFVDMFPRKNADEAIDCYESHRTRGFTHITSLVTTLVLVDGHATPGLRRVMARWLQANTKGTDIDGNNELIPRLDME